MFLLLSVLLSSAQAAPRMERSLGNELSVEVGRITGADDAFESLNDDDTAFATRGVRGAYALGERVSLMGSLHHGSVGSSTYIGATEDWSNSDTGGVALYLTQLAIGPKVHVEPARRLSVYGTLQAEALYGILKLDSDIDEADSAVEMRLRGLAPGGILAGGVELLPFHAGPATLGAHLELGYAHAARLRFRDPEGVDAEDEGLLVGDLEARGLHVRFGLGARF